MRLDVGGFPASEVFFSSASLPMPLRQKGSRSSGFGLPYPVHIMPKVDLHFSCNTPQVSKGFGCMHWAWISIPKAFVRMAFTQNRVKLGFQNGFGGLSASRQGELYDKGTIRVPLSLELG